MIRVILWSVLLIRLSVSGQNSSATPSDEFIIFNQKECFARHKLVSCIKFKTAKMLWKLASSGLGYFPSEQNRMMAEKGRISVVRLTEPSDIQLFADSRSSLEDSELTRIFKFLQRTVELFAKNHGLQIGLSSESGTRITDDDNSAVEPRSRGDKKKKKWLIILPLIILMKIAHFKMTVVPLLLGIIGMNVLLIGGGGWLIHYLKYKTLCKIHPHLVQSHSHVYDSDPSEYSAFVGSSNIVPGGGGGYYTSHDPANYDNDWSSSKAYSAYSRYRA